jgi:hypothetical protein
MLRINSFARGSASLAFLILSIAGQSWLAVAEEAMPTAFDKSRYESLRTKSPFAMATAVVAPTQQAAFAANWFVTSVARIGDANFATIKSRDLATQFSLYGDEPVDGVVLASVDWSDTIGKSTVILRKGTETARLEFNEAQLRAPASTTAAASPAPAGANAAGANAAAANARALGGNIAATNNASGQPGSGPPRRRMLPIPIPR